KEGQYGDKFGVKHHDGGTIGNPAASPQDVPATLQTGEFVVQRKSVAKYGTDFLNALNQGQIYHAGGMVSNMPKAAEKGLRGKWRDAVGSFLSGTGSIGGFTWDQVKNAYSASLSGFGGVLGDVSGMSVAQIVDNL